MLIDYFLTLEKPKQKKRKHGIKLEICMWNHIKYENQVKVFKRNEQFENKSISNDKNRVVHKSIKLVLVRYKEKKRKKIPFQNTASNKLIDYMRAKKKTPHKNE